MESAMALSLCQLGTLIVRQQSYAALDCDAHLVQDHMKTTADLGIGAFEGHE